MNFQINPISYGQGHIRKIIFIFYLWILLGRNKLSKKMPNQKYQTYVKILNLSQKYQT